MKSHRLLRKLLGGILVGIPSISIAIGIVLSIGLGDTLIICGLAVLGAVMVISGLDMLVKEK